MILASMISHMVNYHWSVDIVKCAIFQCPTSISESKILIGLVNTQAKGIHQLLVERVSIFIKNTGPNQSPSSLQRANLEVGQRGTHSVSLFLFQFIPLVHLTCTPTCTLYPLFTTHFTYNCSHVFHRYKCTWFHPFTTHFQASTCTHHIHLHLICTYIHMHL